MVITFSERKKRTKFLILVLIILIFLMVVVIWQGFFTKEKPSPLPAPPTEIPLRKIEINFEILKHPFLEALQPLEEIPSFEGEIGRDNPFLPYQKTKEEKPK